MFGKEGQGRAGGNGYIGQRMPGQHFVIIDTYKFEDMKEGEQFSL